MACNQTNRPKPLKTKLGKWGYSKNLKRGDALQIIQTKARREAQGKQSAVFLRGRVVDIDKVARHAKRAGLLHPQQQQTALPDESRALVATRDVVCITPPPSLPGSLPVIQQWRVPEKILVDVDALIRGMFEARSWRPNGHDLLIRSSWSQTSESITLERFRANLNNGSDAARRSDFGVAFDYWKAAFIQVETLVKAEYHDVIPNLVQRINDLNAEGQGDVAARLKTHIAECCRTFAALTKTNSSRLSILRGLGQLDMAHMVDVEEKILRCFKELFEDECYLGPLYYNSFVMMINTARRRLQRSPWIGFDECLPDLSRLDALFGPWDRRTLDVASLRVEILILRGRLGEAEAEARAFVDRADAVQNDEWQRFYNLTRACFFLGSAQYALRKRGEAIESLSDAQRYEVELSKLNDFGIFTGEKVRIKIYLEALKDENWARTEAPGEC